MRRAACVLLVAGMWFVVAPAVGSVPASEEQQALLVDESDAVIAQQSSSDVGSVFRLYIAYFDRDPDADGLWFWVEKHETGTTLSSISDSFAESGEFTARYGAVDDAAFINLVYESVLGRPADSEGITHWRGQMAAGMTRGGLMIQFSESLEFKTNTGFVKPGEVSRLYRAVFSRVPDSAGLAFWVNQRSNGMPIAAVANQLTQSPEFVAMYGNLENGAFVDLVYNNVLGRDPDVPGRQYWVGELDSSSRGQVVLGFSNSGEFQTRTGIFDRPSPVIPDRPEPVVVDPPTDPEPSTGSGPNFPTDFKPPAPIYDGIFACKFKAKSAQILTSGSPASYKLRLDYSYNNSRSANSSASPCVKALDSVVLTLRGIDGSSWSAPYNTMYPNGNAVVGAAFEMDAFDDNLGLLLDATLTFTSKTGGVRSLSWREFLYAPLRYELESERFPTPIPFGQTSTSGEVTVLPNAAAPNRHVTLQAQVDNSTCTPAGSHADDEWVDVASGVAPFVAVVQVNTTNQIKDCRVSLRIKSGSSKSGLYVSMHHPVLADYGVSGSSSCEAGVCDTFVTLDYQKSYTSYVAQLFTLAGQRQHSRVDLETHRLETGVQTFPIPHSFSDGFCLHIRRWAGTLTTDEGEVYLYQCFVPDGDGWLQVDVPAGRFDDLNY